MPDEIESLSNTEARSGGRLTRPVIIGLTVVGIIVLVSTAAYFLIIRPRHTAVPPAIPPMADGVIGKTSNEESVASPPLGRPQSIPAVQPGQNRPLTAEEKKMYRLPANADIWLKTSSPVDGSQPEMSFYNKTINPNPSPTVPYISPH